MLILTLIYDDETRTHRDDLCVYEFEFESLNPSRIRVPIRTPSK